MNIYVIGARECKINHYFLLFFVCVCALPVQYSLKAFYHLQVELKDLIESSWWCESHILRVTFCEWIPHFVISNNIKRIEPENNGVTIELEKSSFAVITISVT